MTHLERESRAAATEGEDERLLTEEEMLVDIDLLCTAAVTQAHSGNWGRLNKEEEEDDCVESDYRNGGVFRMWEGEISDCFDDQRIALQSTCCPCYRFGKNMKRAGFGSCFLQGFILLILSVIALSNLLAFGITRSLCFLYLAIPVAASIGIYMGYFRMQIRDKFNIKDGDSSLDDYSYHLICPCCTLCQESRTLEMNNVQDGVWHGRGYTICIRSFSDDSGPHLSVSTKYPGPISMQKSSETE